MTLLAQAPKPPPLPAQRASRRRSLRRAVRLECQVLSDLWDGNAPFMATNLSPEGLWLQTPLPLECGEELLVTLRPPRWSDEAPLVAIASVARVGMFRRRSEPQAAGMGLSFVDVDRGQHQHLEACLRGLPPPLPSPWRAARVRGQAPAPTVVAATDDEIALTLAGGLRFVWQAEAPMLGAGEPVAAAPVATPVRAVAEVIELRGEAPGRRRRRHRRARRGTSGRGAKLQLLQGLAS